MKKWFELFLKKIEAANEKNFGTGPMDCCDLNSKKPPATQKHSKKKQQASS